MKSVCVFAGSSPGRRKEYTETAAELGRTLAEQGLTLVYGGSNVGLMNVMANAALEAGGEVIGVAPKWLVDRGIAHTGVSELRLAGSMHERKRQMAELSDAVIALPGALGTMDELFEALTWAQLGLQDRPCGLLNVCRYYDRLIQFLEGAVAERFLKHEHLEMIAVAETPEELLDRLAQYRPPQTRKWIDRG